ncbi:ubiquitin specific peptidase 36 isoform X2 [Musca autumnalis]|uniref:ubiquitin specific peptidase 36 isoform X2 n=1 Tax=Musca autumnalis TaxID=221902 RepID=UPI003CE70F83
MPVSVVCETTANVNAALREELFGSVAGCSAAAAANNKAAADDVKTNGNSLLATDENDSLHGKLVASAKRVLLSKIEYEEVSNYGQSVLESLKSKYIVLKPSTGINNGLENGRNSPATCNNNNNGANGDSSAADANGNSTVNATTPGKRNQQQPNPNELPAPKRVLFPRENVRIGWKATGRKWDVGVGMMNVGNTCYLNSTLQALFHVPSMANWLMSDSAHMERCESSDSGCIICAMAKTLQASQNSQSAIRPYFVYSKLKSICKHLVMGRQEDAHEFLRYLVEAMEKSYLQRFRNYKELDQYSKETTPLNQILGGYLKTSVKCLSCQHVSVTFQHFQDLLLDIRKADTIDEALEGYFARERLEDMGYKCEACKKKVSATKQFSLDRAPIALCIQLKRFSMLGTKINKQITIKPRLDLTKFASRKIPGEQLTYRLVAMVTHLGASQHCGHYTAIGLTESGTYYNYDDSYVRPISMQNVCNTNAYIIFYEMDTQPPRQVTSTQVSGAVAQSTVTNAKELQATKVNGHVNSSPQRIIGPQLPPGYSNGNISSSPLTNGGGSKLTLNRNATTPVKSTTALDSNKITIHFKNNNGTAASSTPVKTSVATSSLTSASASSSTSSTSVAASNSVFDSLKNTSNTNGLHAVGTGKFQESASKKHALGGSATKRQINNAKNGNESSSDNDDDENEVVSSSTSTLPSMPKLGSAEVNSSNPSPKATPLTNGFAKKLPAPIIKSLVPYGSETDEETDVATPTTTNGMLSSSSSGETKRLISNPLKRRQSSSSWSNAGSSSSSDNDDDDRDADCKPTTGTKIKKAASSTTVTSAAATDSSSSHYNGNSSKKSSEIIDDIFSSNKRSTTATTTTSCLSPLKKKSQNQQFTVTSTTPTSESFSSASNSDSEDVKSSLKPQFKRSKSTPPSPPVVKTNSGIWQVTSLHPISACVSPTTEKLPKNPFATTKPSSSVGDLNKRVKKENSGKQNFVGNGYQRESATDTTVSELLKQSHRGYGAPVLTWNGQQSEIERENYYLFDEKRIEDDNNSIKSNHNNKSDAIDDCKLNNDFEVEDFGYSDEFVENRIEEDNNNRNINYNNKISDGIDDFEVPALSDNDDGDGGPAFFLDQDHDPINVNNFVFNDYYKDPSSMPLEEEEENWDSHSDNVDIQSTTTTTTSLLKPQPLHLNINNNNLCLPLPENCTNLKEGESSNNNNQNEILTATTSSGEATTTEEQNNIDSCSSATTATTVINTYCLSPNSTDNEPTTPTLATTINDIIFQFSEDSSLDNL